MTQFAFIPVRDGYKRVVPSDVDKKSGLISFGVCHIN